MQVVRKSRKVVNNMQTLRAMARSGHIVLQRTRVHVTSYFDAIHYVLQSNSMAV